MIRGFASSSRRSIKPESPNSIDVPRAIQPVLEKKRIVKGTLPVPRELFPPRRRDKPSQAYLDAVTPEPSSKARTIDPNDPHARYREWASRIADKRRRNLREGLLELYDRKQRTREATIRQATAEKIRRGQILNQPEREDERLTRPSIPKDLLRAVNHGRSPKRFKRRWQRRVALNRRISSNRGKLRWQRRRMERIDDLHTLYMNARQFITTEDKLNAAVDKAFPEGENPAWRNDHQPGENIWNLGPPQNIEGAGDTNSRAEAYRWDIVQDRLKKLGEKITGGKM